MSVYQTGTFEIMGRRSMSDDDYADALLRYWATVREGERTVAPFFDDGVPHSPEQLAVIAGVVARVGAAEDMYFAALQAAGHAVPRSSTLARDN
jgi:hypothetical protein